MATVAAAAFLLSPLTISTCITRPTVVFTNTATLTAIAKAVAGCGIATILALAVTAYLSLYPVFLLPMLLLAYSITRESWCEELV